MAEKINIVFLLSRIMEKGGISRVTSIISNELGKDDQFDIHLVSYQKQMEEGYVWNKKLSYHNLVEVGVTMKRGIWKANKKLRQIIRQNNIHIVISCGQEVGPLGVMATRWGKTKFIYWSHSSFKGKTHSKFKKMNELFTTSFTHAVVSLTKTDQVNYKKGTLAKRVVQIYNPIDSRLLQKNSSYNPDSRKIISVGRLSDQKNFLLLVDVAKIVLDKHRDVEWHIYGSGDQETEILGKIKKNNLVGRLHLMGQARNLYDLYQEYSMLVMTSKFEGFPMSLIEGLASKLPLVSFDIPTGPNEIIKDGINGYLIPPNDVEAMSDKIDVLLENRAKRIAFSKATVGSVQNFGMEIIIDQWKSLFDSLVDNQNS